jgi:catechol 2,3-dioxygenase-like lactoylglutathione lyase family enzyme
MTLMMEPVPGVGGFGADFPFFWIASRGHGPDSGTHVAFMAEDRETVDAFHAAALEAGGADNGGPGVREIYHPLYYGAFVLDPDGNNMARAVRTKSSFLVSSRFDRSTRE